MNAELSGRGGPAALLALLGGGVVVFGGAALTYLALAPKGAWLGAVHLALGVAVVGSALGMFRGSRVFRSLSLLSIGAVIAYSCTSEAVIAWDTLLAPAPALGSLGGTVVAVALLGSSAVLLLRGSS